MNLNTICVHGSKDKNNSTGAISVPIYQSATFVHNGENTEFDYSRLKNPTRQCVEQVVAKLENGTDCLALSSGMAAINCIIELFSPNDHIIASDDLYGGSHRLFNSICKKNGITFSFIVDSNIEQIKKLIKSETKAIFIETPTNPMMNVVDIEALSKIAKQNNLLLIVDNTFLTPYFQNPLNLGADIVVHSGTKYLGGHNDTLAGFLVTKNSDLYEKLSYIYKTIGACLSAFDSWLLIRGIKTLPIRMEKQQQNAIAIANWLIQQPKIKKVFYTGLESHPNYNISKKQARGFGSMISFEVETEQLAKQILNKVKIIQFAESLGGVETLITYPITQTHADLPKEQQEARGINEKLLRISVGIEDIDDLLNDLKQAISDRE